MLALHELKSSANKLQSAPLRVFVVEDSELIRRRIVENVRTMKRFEVVGIAEHEDEAVEAIDRLRPDIVITDIRLKTGNGIGVVRHVRAHPYVPRPLIFVLTNYAFPEYRYQCTAAGADDFFDKSSEYDRFLDSMHDA
jgi:DNA-binding NarL/FixJ family response regulator